LQALPANACLGRCAALNFAESIGFTPFQKIRTHSRFTLSSNIAHAVSMRTGVTFEDAKQWFHGGVSGFVAAMLEFFGAGLGATLGFASLLFVWLESFDASGQLR
jgi:hypothetical protein